MEATQAPPAANRLISLLNKYSGRK